MLKIYGSRLCPDCVQCVNDLTAAGVEFEYHDFSEELGALKTFLTLREKESVFESVRDAGKIGIPCIVTEEGNVTLSWVEFM